MADELRADRSPAQLAAAVTLYHIVIEAALAQPGQHFICSYLEDATSCRRSGRAWQNIAADEQRHIGFGVKLLVRPQPRRPGRRAEGGRAASCAT